jgi:hypothetical protein
MNGSASEFRHDEGQAPRHQPGDEGDVARKPIELRDGDRARPLLRQRECRGELRPAIERIGSLAGLDLDERADDRDAFRLAMADRRRGRRPTAPCPYDHSSRYATA